MDDIENNTDKSKLLTRAEAAKYLGLKKNTLALWASLKRYDLPYIKVGRLVKYRLSDLEDFINSRERSHT